MASITALNSAYVLAVPGLIPATVLQGFSADDIFGTDSIERIETLIGVDGKLSGGLVSVKVTQKIMLQADSPSNLIFEQWRAAEQAARDVFFANATISLVAIGRKYACANGLLTNYQILADAGKLLKPRSFTITWESVTAAPN